MEKISIEEIPDGGDDASLPAPDEAAALGEEQMETVARLAWMRAQIALLPRRQAWAVKLRASGMTVTQVARSMQIT